MNTDTFRVGLLAAGCGLLLFSVSSASPPAETAPLCRVVTSVAPIADLVRQVGGPDAEVVQLIPDGRDAHTFDPAPSVAREFSRCDGVIFNGLDLEDALLKMARANVPARAPVLLLGEAVIPPEDWIIDRGFSQGNPHVWLNVVYARRYVEAIRDALEKADPSHAVGFRARAEKFLKQLSRLDEAILSAVQTIPPQHRKLVTYHDSWSYFGRRYGLAVIAAIQPVSFLEPSAQEIAAIVRQIRESGVPAIFGSEVFPSPMLEMLGRETGARYVDALRDDVLPGEPGSPAHSYVGMMVENARVMVAALGGDTTPLKDFPLAND